MQEKIKPRQKMPRLYSSARNYCYLAVIVTGVEVRPFGLRTVTVTVAPLGTACLNVLPPEPDVFGLTMNLVPLLFICNTNVSLPTISTAPDWMFEPDAIV